MHKQRLLKTRKACVANARGTDVRCAQGSQAEAFRGLVSERVLPMTKTPTLTTTLVLSASVTKSCQNPPHKSLARRARPFVVLLVGYRNLPPGHYSHDEPHFWH